MDPISGLRSQSHPSDIRPRILTTNISLEEATCDVNLVLSVAEFFGVAPDAAKTIVKQVAAATATWREVAATMGSLRPYFAVWRALLNRMISLERLRCECGFRVLYSGRLSDP
jgi:hypothetical protein